MTESEWLAAGDPEAILEAFPGLGSDRKWRLLVCACCYRIYDETQAEWAAVRVAERFADNLATLSQLKQAEAVMSRGDYRYSAADYAVSPDVTELAGTFEAATWAVRDRAEFLKQDGWQAILQERAVQAALLRDVFGNPFRPVAFDAEWRTSTAVLLAQQMYESRDFSAMPILADALQDAGCNNADVLNHCRDVSGIHARGCWVVDLVLGRK